MALLPPVPPMSIISLPYHHDSAVIFDSLRSLPFACWLDSGKPNSHSGRYDIITALPSKRWVADGHKTIVYHYQYNASLSCSSEKTTLSDKDIFSHISQAAQENRQQTPLDLPFTGGLIGYLGYDLGRNLAGLASDKPSPCKLPQAVVGHYDWAVIQDHTLKRCYLASLDSCPKTVIETLLKQIDSIGKRESKEAPALHIGKLTSNMSYSDYRDKLTLIDDYIHAGDCYQVNFAQCFSAPYQGDPYHAYRQLRQAMASPFSAFMDLGNQQSVLSLSPERLLQLDQGEVLTQPIKGTIARHSIEAIDQENAQQLQLSHKNRAENLMIVDLLRNDLGKSCEPGSIQVPKLFSLESYPNVHHLVSSITGTLDKHANAIDLLQGCFPGGSITGAPKRRAMEIIDELEPCQRSVYCGSIFYVNTAGDMDSNITIRTIACDSEHLYCWGGGGIVADSDIDEEYQESLTKINRILESLATFS